MPPKKQQQQQLKGKAAEKKKQEIVEDKTFGMKNKNKSKKVQQYVQLVKKQADQQVDQHRGAKGGSKGGGGDGDEGGGANKASKKALLAARAAELAMYDRPVAEPKKEVRRDAKVDLYADQRQQKTGGGGGGEMDNWDQQQLEEVIAQKHGKQERADNQTSIVCKHFLDAVESGKYGWFWTCPNGGDKCQYRHALPPGFVMRSKAERDAEREAAKAAVEASVEDEIERERARLATATPVTLERFTAWKEKKRKQREAEERQRKEAAKKKASAASSAKSRVAMAYGLSGRDLFEYKPELFVDDADADVERYHERIYEDNEEEENETGAEAEAEAEAEEKGEDEDEEHAPRTDARRNTESASRHADAARNGLDDVAKRVDEVLALGDGRHDADDNDDDDDDEEEAQVGDESLFGG